MADNNRKKIAAILIVASLISVLFMGVIWTPQASGASEPAERFRGYNLEQGKWTTGDLGKDYTEGDFVSYQLRIDSASKIWGASSFDINYNFYQKSSDAIYIDGFDTTSSGFQYSKSADFLTDSEQIPTSSAWTHIYTPDAGDAPTSGTYASITHYMDAYPAGSTDGTEGSSPAAERYFTVTGIDWSGADHIILFFRAHLALSLIWTDGLEDDLPQPLSGTEFDGWDASHNGSSFATGSSRHFTLDYPGVGAKTIPIPIANYPMAKICGHKYLSEVQRNDWQITLDGQIDLGLGTLSIPYHPAPVLTGTSPWTAGYYEFTGLVKGIYTVTEATTGYYVDSILIEPNDAGTTNIVDGSATVTLSRDGVVTVDFYNVERGNIIGYKHEDSNLSDGFDTGDAGLAGWTIKLYESDGTTLISSTTTASDGSYSFMMLPPGNYVVEEESRAGWTAVSSASVSTAVTTGRDTVVDFLNVRNPYINGYKYEDSDLSGGITNGDAKLAGWTIQLWKVEGAGATLIRSTTTDAQGFYNFTIDTPGTYYVKEVVSDASWTALVSQSNYIVLTHSGDRSSFDFVNVLYPYINGYKYEDSDLSGGISASDVKLAGWTIELWRVGTSVDTLISTTTTNAQGFYNFTINMPGTYYVKEVAIPAGWTAKIGPTSGTYILDNSGDHASFNFLNVRYPYVNGYKYEDTDLSRGFTAGDVKLDGWTIELWKVDGTTAEQTTTTDANGFYNFTITSPGIYYVKEVGYSSAWTVVIGPTSVNYVLDSSGEKATCNFLNVRYPYIDGYKYEDSDLSGEYNEGDITLAGWTIQLWEVGTSGNTMVDSTTTDAQGYYKFIIDTPGTYFVKEVNSIDGWTALIEASSNYGPVQSGNHWGFDFVNVLYPYLNGYKYEDSDLSGGFSEDDVVLSGWRIELYKIVDGQADEMSAWTVTDANGFYNFTIHPAGTYYVKEVNLPAGWSVVVGPESGSYDLISSGEHGTFDFLNVRLPYINGYKYEDTDLSGGRSLADVKLAGWTIELWEVGGAAALQTTTTDANGFYNFTIHSPGTYYVKEDGYAAGWTAIVGPQSGSIEVVRSGDHSSFNFVNVRYPYINGYKYEDTDLSGGYSTGDIKLAGWTVELYKVGIPTAVQTTTTDSTGFYNFSITSPGTYYVKEVISDESWTALVSESGSIALFHSGDHDSFDFVNVQYPYINGYKYEDSDLSGGFSSADVTLAGWTIELWKVGGSSAVKTTTTDANGFYNFTITEPSAYYVKEIGYSSAWTALVGPASGEFLLDNSGDKASFDFLNVQYPYINGYKYEDSDLSGGYSAGDSPLSGWTIQLWMVGTSGDTLVETKTTDGNGFYNFTIHAAGTYYVKEVGYPSGWTALAGVTSSNFVLDNSGEHASFAFVNVRYPYINGYKYEDSDLSGGYSTGDVKLAGWTIELYKVGAATAAQTTVTDINGFYNFTVTEPGTFYVKEVISDESWTSIVSESGEIALMHSGDHSSFDFVNVQYPYLNGYKYEDTDLNGMISTGDVKLSGWTVQLWKVGESEDSLINSITTDSNGFFNFTIHASGTYYVKEVGYSSAWDEVIGPTSGDYVLMHSGDKASFDFLNVRYPYINGYKYEDSDLSGTLNSGDQPLEGWTIELWDVEGAVAAQTTTTNSAGFYNFTITSPGTYYVKEVGYASSWTEVIGPQSGDFALLHSGDCASFTFLNVQYPYINGFKYEDSDLSGGVSTGDVKLAGWTVELYKEGVANAVQTTTTDINGFYNFTITEPGTYYVKEVISDASWTALISESDSITIVHSGDHSSFDFVNVQYPYLNGYKYEDSDLSGIIGAGDAKLSGWTIQLWKVGESGDSLIDSTTTDSNGFYNFTIYSPGTYYVKEVGFPAGWTAVIGPISGDYVLDSSGDKASFSFLNVRYPYINGYKYEDSDLSGGFSIGDVALSGWTIELWMVGTSGNELVGTTTTDSDGFYNFTIYAAGTYFVKEVGYPAGWTAIAGVTSSNSILDNSGEHASFTFLNVRYPYINGYKYEDSDLSGGYSANDVKLAGWTIQLYKDGVTEVVQTTTTDNSGFYNFTITEPGTYYVKEVNTDSSWTAIVSESGGIDLMHSGDHDSFDFVNVQYPYLNGYKYEDSDLSGGFTASDVKLAGWTIELWKEGESSPEATTTTDADGFYNFTIHAPGTYYVKEIILSSEWTAEVGPTSGNFVLDNSGDKASFDFLNVRYPYLNGFKYEDTDLSGDISSGDRPLEGWTIELYMVGVATAVGTTTTNSFGFYNFSITSPGSYYVKEVGYAPSWTEVIGPQSGEFLLDSSGEKASFDFLNVQYPYINGYKYEDTDLSGGITSGDAKLAGWTVELWKVGGTTAEQTTTTDAYGFYNFTIMEPGTYYVKEVISDVSWSAIVSESGEIALFHSGDHDSFDFVNVRYPYINGYKYEDSDLSGGISSGDAPIQGWTVELWEVGGSSPVASMTTDEEGFYNFTINAPGTYYVKEVGYDSSWTPVTSAQSDNFGPVMSGNSWSFDFLNVQYPYINGYKYEDTDLSGGFNNGDVGLTGWTIQLWKVGFEEDELIQTKTTDADGFYNFTITESGTYYVKEVGYDASWTPVTMEYSSNFGPVFSGDEFCFIFVNVQYPYLNGYKYEDSDLSGGITGNDVKLAGWTIELYKVGTEGAVQTTTTDSNGFYNFTIMEPGTYYVKEVISDVSWTALVSESGDIELMQSGHHDSFDFVNVQYPYINGYKYEDSNLDGCLNNGDAALSGWTVELFKVGITDAVQTTTTDNSGFYNFTITEPGTYYVKEVCPVGWTVAIGPQSGNIALLNSGDYGSFDFLNVRYPYINGYKYEDTDLSGAYNTGDVALSSWTIELWKMGASGNEYVGSTTTDSNGFYNFSITSPGTYFVKEVGYPAGWIALVGVTSSQFAMDGSGEHASFDFLNVQYPYINGYKHEDSDLSGGITSGDVKLAGWEIQLWKVGVDGDELVDTDFTDSNGFYNFTIMEPGTYYVKEMNSDGSWTAVVSESGEIALMHSGDHDSFDFVNVQYPYINGYKYEDSDLSGGFNAGDFALSGWTIQLWLVEGSEPVATTTTDASGFYNFTIHTAGTYYVKEVMRSTGWIAEVGPTSGNFVLDNSGESATFNFLNVRYPYLNGFKYEDTDLSGDISSGDRPLEGWTIELWEAGATVASQTTTTDSTGFYNFTIMEPGAYYVKEVGYVSSWTEVIGPQSGDFLLDNSGDKASFDFLNVQYPYINGYKFEDSDLSGGITIGDRKLAGWEIQLWKVDVEGDVVIDTTTTDANGFYNFTITEPGTYYVKEVITDNSWIAIVSESGEIELMHSGEFASFDFVNVQYPYINGYKYEDTDLSGDLSDADQPISGWTVELWRVGGTSPVATTTTDSTGFYNFTITSPGTYYVKEVGYDSSWTPVTADISGDFGPVASGDHFTFTFLNVQYPYINGYKYEDTDLSGGFNAGDAGIAGWEIQLWKVGVDGDELVNTDFTDSNGFYNFTIMEPGTYYVKEVGYDSSWTPETADQSGNFGPVVSGDQLSFTFLNVRYPYINGYKYEDTDLSGGYSSEDVKLAGWTIQLWQVGGSSPVSTTTTDSNGLYNFTITEPGTYYVKEVISDASWTAIVSQSGEIELFHSGDHDSFDFVNVQYPYINGYKHGDSNLDGAYGSGDESLAGWTIELWEVGGTSPVAITTTDSNGFYNFTIMEPGTYYVKEVYDDQIWAAVTADTSGQIDLLRSGSHSSFDFLNVMLMEICGYKYRDYDWIEETVDDDAPVEGWLITLYLSLDGGQTWTEIRSTTTDASGYYCFEGLTLAGLYNVSEEYRFGWLCQGNEWVDVEMNAPGQERRIDFLNAFAEYPGGHTIGFWKNNIGKNLGYTNGHYQVDRATIEQYLASISAKYGTDYDFLYGLTLEEAYDILSIVDASDMIDKAQAQILSLVLTAEFRGEQFADSAVYLPDVGQGGTYVGDGQGAIDYILDLYGAGMFAAAQRLADGMNNAPKGVEWYSYW